MAQPPGALTERLRVTVAAIGWTGHAFPAIALARELHSRGHEVVVETFERWRDVVGNLGLGFVPAPERIRFAGLAGDAAPSLAEVARDLVPVLRDRPPDVVVSDLFTLAPALAAELAGVRRASLIPHPYPAHAPGLPFYPLGLLPPRTPLGTLAWRAMWPAVGTRLPNTRLREVRAALDATRDELGLAPVARYDGQISDQLAIVATFPQLEYPRRWPPHVHVSGPMRFELPHPEVELPAGDEPLVVVAASTERDPALELIGAVLEALADEPVRVIATTNRSGGGLRGFGAAEREGGAVAVLQPGAARGRTGRLARWPRDGHQGACRRRPGPRLPTGWRHGRERRSGGLGRRWTDASAPAAEPRPPAPGGAAAVGRPPLRRSSRCDRRLVACPRRCRARRGPCRAPRP